MKKLAIVFAVGTAALMGGSVANAADNSVKAKTSTDVTQSSTDISSPTAVAPALARPSRLGPPSLPAVLQQLRLLRPAPVRLLRPRTPLLRRRTRHNLQLRQRRISRLVRDKKARSNAGFFLVCTYNSRGALDYFVRLTATEDDARRTAGCFPSFRFETFAASSDRPGIHLPGRGAGTYSDRTGSETQFFESRVLLFFDIISFRLSHHRAGGRS